MFGTLTLEAITEHDMLQQGAVAMMVLVALGVIGLLFYLKRWKWLWNEWLTTLDPKKIGIMYIIVVCLMLFKGLADAAMMRLQQAVALGPGEGIITADHFQQVFSAHGSTMIFFVGMGVVFGLFNLIIPLQIGARDVAFPFVNALSFWLFAAGANLMNISLAVGDFSIAGWLAYPPLSGLEYSPGEGVDYWIWILQIAGVGSTLGGINFFATIFKMRCPGMTLMKMPIFVWSALGSLILIIFAFPILTATLFMLALDRYMDMCFFTSSFGGNFMMYVNLIWAWGHPEVYILVLPAFGIFSEVVATFAHKRLFGYVSMVWAIIAITFLSFIVWLHHFFTMGASPHVNAFFAIMTMLIAIPTGVKIFNWLFTQYHGKIHFKTPTLWFMAFIIMFTIGGMTGVLLSIPPVDFQVHNSLFLIAHFHSVIIGGVLFAFFAGFSYWFPKFMGFKLNERIGRYAFFCWLIGFLLAFMPLYLLGFMGATRRLDHYDASTGWHPYFLVAGLGLVFVMTGLGLQVFQVLYSILKRDKERDFTGDPWNGRTLEWMTASPPPFYNFAKIPTVNERDPFWEAKQAKENLDAHPPYESFHMPKNSCFPFLMGFLATGFGFALTWRMMEISAGIFIAMLICLILRLSQDEVEYMVSVEEIEKIEAAILKRKRLWQSL